MENHTKGRYWLEEYPNSIWVGVMADKKHIATIPYKTKEEQANAQRIVRVMNMHDELIEVAKEQMADLSKCSYDDLTISQKRAFDKLSKLLKQAEQK